MLDELLEQAFSSKDGKKIAVIAYNDSDEEYQVYLFENNHLNPDATYYADGYGDALGTAQEMVK